jgi:hypothetical protein
MMAPSTYLTTFAGLVSLVAAIPAPAGLTNRQPGCPKDLPALPGFEFPHLIVPISKAHPDAANPNTYFPVISPDDLATVFNFDILNGDQTCELGFYFPYQDQLETSSFTFNGPYAGPATFVVQINQLGIGATDGFTTWNNQPGPAFYEGFPKTLTMAPGNYYSLWTGACPAGLWSITISSPDSNFCWFQDYNPCRKLWPFPQAVKVIDNVEAIGPYVTYNGPI